MQPATIGDTEVDLRGSLIIRCSERADASMCTCFSQNTDGSIESRAENSVGTSDAGEACTLAQAPCREAVDVVFADRL